MGIHNQILPTIIKVPTVDGVNTCSHSAYYKSSSNSFIVQYVHRLKLHEMELLPKIVAYIVRRNGDVLFFEANRAFS
jgi:hypothetical protein